LDSAGTSLAGAGGDVCAGGVACATRSSGFALTAEDRAVSASPATTITEAIKKSVPFFRSFDIASHRQMNRAVQRAVESIVPGNLELRFRRSQAIAATFDANFGIKEALAIIDAGAAFEFEVPMTNSRRN
jgi:hypothetical protein